MFSLPFDYTREKLQSQGNKRRYSPTYECFTNTAAVVFPSFFSFFLSRRGVGSNRFGPSAHRASNTGVVRNKAHTATTTYEGTSGGTFFPSRLHSLCA